MELLLIFLTFIAAAIAAVPVIVRYITDYKELRGCNPPHGEDATRWQVRRALQGPVTKKQAIVEALARQGKMKP